MRSIGPLLPFALLFAACPVSVTEPSSTTTSGTTTTATSTTATTTGTTTTATGTTTTTAGACGSATCTANQLCVRPACMDVTGENCYFGTPDAGAWSCPPGTKRDPHFDADCVQPGFACVDGCPPAPPFCVDLPSGCGGVPTCGCLASDPCQPSNSGACHDADIVGNVLSCSLTP